MPVSLNSSAPRRRRQAPVSAALLLLFGAALCPAASIRGVVSDATGAKVTGANVVLMSGGKAVSSAVSTADGSFQILTGSSGRFFLLVSAKSFRELETPDFYAGRFDSIERDIVLEPAWVRESVVVTATGTPTPQPQTSAATTVLGPLDLALRTGLIDALQLMPGAFLVQTGQRGAQTSLFIRGGDSDDNKVLLDGIDVGDLGGQFDFGPLSATAVERAEVYRGPDTNLYGAGAMTGVVSLTTPRGTTSFPSLLFQGSAGNFNTSREQLEVAGADKKIDYLGAFSWLQTGNSIPNDEYHVATAAANLGWQLGGNTQIRGTAHYGADATGVPNAWDFYHVADNATQKDLDLYASASLDNQTTAKIHNTFRYGLARKDERYDQWSPEGTCIPAGSCGAPGVAPTYSGGNFYGQPVTILGANGYSASGQALLDYSWANGSVYPYESQLGNNRDQLVYQGDVTITPHLAALVGFHFEDERGLENIPAYATHDTTERMNYDYLASVHGDFKRRFFYTLAGGLEHYSLFGVQTSPRGGVSWYVLKPREGVFSGTRILLNFGDAVREPDLTDQFGSLYQFLVTNGYQSVARQLDIGPLSAPSVRTYEGGLAQSFLSGHVMFRASYFHNQFGREIEYVGGQLLPNLIPGLTAAGKQQLEAALGYDYTDDYGLAVNTEAFQAQGAEASVEGGIGRNIFLRGGYTYLDAVVQRSFDSDNEALAGGYEPTYAEIPIGAISPLVGARPFRRPPHTGYLTATYATKRLTGVLTGAFASRSDDSTFLEYEDASGRNSLLLPNRNLDYGYARLDLGGSYQLFNWMDIFVQGDNLMSNQHMGPIGYESLPLTVRGGLRLRWEIGSGR